MERRLAGMVVLLVALTVLVAAPRLLSPALVARPSALPLPLPPAVGSCLRWEPALTVVPCTAPHAAEVTAGWTAVATVRTADDGDSRCRAAAFQYVGLTLVGAAQVWRPAFGNRSWQVPAPPAERAGDRGWSVCVVAPALAAVSVGSVRDQGRNPLSRPAAFGMCLTVDAILVACDRPHRVEYLTDAVGFARSLIGEREADNWRTGCGELAAALLDTGDPTFGGRLTIEFRTVPADPRSGFDPPSSIAFALCAVVVDGDRDLIGSVYGLGAGALPLA